MLLVTNTRNYSCPVLFFKTDVFHTAEVKDALETAHAILIAIQK